MKYLSNLSLRHNTLFFMATFVFFLFCVMNQQMLSASPYSQVSEQLSIDLSLPMLDDSDLTYAEEVQDFADQLRQAYDLNPERATKFSSWILESSVYSGVSERLISGLIMTESSFRYNAVSSVGAVGPGQIRPKFWNGRCLGDLTNPKANIICAGYVLRHYYENSCNKDWQCTVRTYNVGPTNMRRSPAYQEASLRYLAKIDRYVQMLNDENTDDTSYELILN